MLKKLFYVVLCVILLSGCEKFTLDSKKQVTQDEISYIAEEDTNLESDSETLSEGNETGSEEQEDMQSMGESVNITNDTIAKKYCLPDGFVYVDDVIPTVGLDIRYYSDYNLWERK